MENRYDRQIRVKQIGKKGQEKIEQATVLIIGCGALGTYSAEQLVRMGIKHLILVDHDVIEFTNLQRQTLFTEEDAKQHTKKVVAAKKALQKINSKVEINIYPEYFQLFLLSESLKIDLILDCTDNFSVRALINTFASSRNCPYIFTALAGTSGQLMPLLPSKGPCLNCLLPNLDELQERGCDTLGVLTPAIPFISSLQISLAIKIILGEDAIDWQTVYQVDLWQLSITYFHVEKNTSCPTCQNKKAHHAVKQPDELPLVKLCGTQVYQGKLIFSDLKHVQTILKKQNWPYQQNPLALAYKIGDTEITIFKNGKIHLFQFESRELADKHYQFLKELLTHSAKK